MAEIVEGYDDIKIATVCSHSSLQIFHGARKEGFGTLGIAIGSPPRFYDAFPRGKPDEYIILDDYTGILDIADDLIEKNAVLIPHGSFVEYLGAKNVLRLGVPMFGNRRVLEWESDRRKQREWLTSAGVRMPSIIDNPKSIDRPVLVKYDGAKGGRGFFIAKDEWDFKIGIDPTQNYMIQEYVMGTRYYLHYFYSPISIEGYRLSKGSLQLLSMDRRDETNIDEIYKLGSMEDLKRLGIFPSFVVTGNVPVVLRESLLPMVFEMGERTVERSIELFGGLIGPFCLETIVTDKLDFVVFEISARIVAGTNPFIGGSPYAELIEPDLSTGIRIAREIRNAKGAGRLAEIIS